MLSIFFRIFTHLYQNLRFVSNTIWAKIPKSSHCDRAETLAKTISNHLFKHPVQNLQRWYMNTDRKWGKLTKTAVNVPIFMTQSPRPQHWPRVHLKRDLQLLLTCIEFREIDQFLVYLLRQFLVIYISFC